MSVRRSDAVATPTHATTSAMSHDTATAQPSREMVSFGFLPEADDHPASPFAFGSLLGRMRTAFAAASSSDAPKRAPVLKERISHPIPPPPPPTRRRSSRLYRAPHHVSAPAHGIIPLRTVSPLVTMTPVNSVSLPQDDGTVRPLPGHEEAEAESDSRRNESAWSFLGGAIQSVPGFPLGGDVLDDAQSFTTVRRGRSDVGDETLSTISARPSADAWIRRFRGEGLSRKYWMADETAKECRNCLMPFTSLRRKHHCRICGQIFCSRCASNIVPGERWGQKGGVRTCDQCKAMLEEYDRREQIDAEARAQSHARKGSSVSNAATEADEPPDLHTPLSQFAATTLFANDANALPRRRDSDVDEEADASQLDIRRIEALGDVEADESTVQEVAPFRSGLSDDTDAPETDLLPTDHPTSVPLGIELGTSSAVAAPTDHDTDPDSVPTQLSTNKAESLPVDDQDEATAPEVPSSEPSVIIASDDEGSTHLQDKPPAAHPTTPPKVSLPPLSMSQREPDPATPPLGSPIKRSTARQKLMHGASRFVTSTALGPASLVYFLRMLHQLLLAEHVGDVQEWKEIIKLLALSVIERIHVRTRNTVLTDIRHFVKIKCFPGGQVSDCEFLDGFVCTKNVGTRGMASFLPMRHARIMIIAFPIEYHRNASQLMSLESIMAQEREFLRILVARIAAKRPHVVISEKSVSHMALEMFEKARIVVFSCMKRTAIDTIAHCTQAEIISSIDRLALEPRLGRCATISVDTYQQFDEPARRKPLLRIEVTSKEVSSALVLRGATLPKLRRIKAILALMVFVGYNLKLEEFLRRDVGAVLDWSVINFHAGPSQGAPSQPNEDDMQRRIILDETLKKYQRLLLSASISVVLPPPYLVTRMKYVFDRIHMLRATEMEQETFVYKAEDDTPSDDDTVALQDHSITLCAPHMWRHTTDLAMLEAEQCVIQTCWHACVSHMTKLLTPFAHQRLIVLAAKTCAATLQTCYGPDYATHELYGPDDVPLGQFLENTCAESLLPCDARGCDSANLVHYKTWIHNAMQVQMVIERFACPLPGQEDVLLCWSYCKTCETTTPVTRLSDEGWSVSFAKYLELQFYPNASCHSSTCQHDYYRDAVRYFALHNFAIRFHAEPIELWEVVPPILKSIRNDENLCETVNTEVKSLFEKNLRYWRSVCGRITALRQELATRDVYAEPALAKVRTEADALLERILDIAVADCAEVEQRLSDSYWQLDRSILTLNDVRRFLQDKVVEWDMLFIEFDKQSSVSERELRRLAEHYRKRAAQRGDGDDTDTEMTDTPMEKRHLELSSFMELWAGFDKEKHKEEAQRIEDAKRISVSIDGVAASSRERSASSSYTASRAPPGSEEKATSPSSSVTPPSQTPAPEEAKDDAPQTHAAPDEHEHAMPAMPTMPTSESAATLKLSQKDDAPTTDETPAVTATSTQPDAGHEEHASAPPTEEPALLAPVPRTPAASPLTTAGAPSRTPSPSKPRYRPSHETLQAAKAALRPATSRASEHRARMDAENSSSKTPVSGLRLTRPPNSFASFVHHRSEGLTLRPPWSDTKNTRHRTQESVSKVRREATARSQVAKMAKHYDQLHRDAEHARLASRVRRARPVTTTHATVEVFKSLRDAVRGDESDNEDDAKPLEQSNAARRGASWLGEDARVPPSSRSSTLEPKIPEPQEGIPDPGPHHTEATGPMSIQASAPAGDSVSEFVVPGQSVVSETASMPPMPSQTADDVRSIAASDTGTDVPLSETASISDGTVPETSTEIVPERTRLFHVLESIWRMHVGHMKALDYPFLSTDHVFSDARVVVREDEPSSIIAFTLDSHSYRDQLLQSRQSRRAQCVDERTYLEQELRRTEGLHSLYEFDTGSVKLWCKVFFAEQFDALRQLCECDAHFVSSLARCVKWQSQGGKSGSAFLKTRDDRLVVKQLSRAELDGFSKFAPEYFSYLADCQAQERPTTLTKIYGYFRIGFKNNHTGKGFKMDFLVMENLLYGRTATKIFDLKGSTRHRFAQETGSAHEVLLDENLARYVQTAPLYVREHSKRILRTALYNDSLFLTDMNVMDYSLIVALDATRNELVIGIIDYLRTYTWDKRVESFVKETAILGGGGKGEPTIITPRQYRMRFLTFLDRHVLMTPDPWMQPGWVQ